MTYYSVRFTFGDLLIAGLRPLNQAESYDKSNRGTRATGGSMALIAGRSITQRLDVTRSERFTAFACPEFGRRLPEMRKIPSIVSWEVRLAHELPSEFSQQLVNKFRTSAALSAGRQQRSASRADVDQRLEGPCRARGAGLQDVQFNFFHHEKLAFRMHEQRHRVLNDAFH